ncbi:MAG: rhodanese-like domain-containing protein [Planctomycetota bacterium]
MILNAGSYKFARFSEDELPALRETLLNEAVSRGILGTILLSTEGINLNLSGEPEAVRALYDFVQKDTRLAGLDIKESFSKEMTFRRMLVKIKREIISMGRDEVKPDEFTAPRVTAQELQEMLDRGDEVTLLDTRNTYEYRLGTFEGAEILPIETFRAFPKAIENSELDREKPVVTFCTGGIRCEKASALMLEAGFKEVYQLHGGILRYFEECGGTHYDGECFVYDRRVSVHSNLEESGTALCFNCQSAVTLEEQKSPAYVPDVSCPHCIDGKPEKAPFRDVAADG